MKNNRFLARSIHCSLLNKILITMKLVIVLLFAIIFQAQAEGYAQSVSLSYKNASIEKVFRDVKKETGYNILCDVQLLDKIGHVDIDVKDEPIETVLEEILSPYNLTYSIENKTIVISESDIKKIEKIIQQQPERINITGKVTDAFDNTSLPGVSVVVVGTTRGTMTDTNGVYELSVNEGDSVMFSFIGYKPQKIKVTKVRVVNINLSEDTEMLDDAVVVAFGTQAKESVVSSITTVNVKDLRVPSSNLTTALAGRMAGLVAYQSTGAPGEEDAQF